MAVANHEMPVSLPRKLDGLRILAVEDSPEDAGLLKVILQASGATVRLATSVEEARQALGSGPFDVLVADSELGDGTGADLLGVIRSGGGAQRDLRAIALTGHTGEKLRDLLRAGFSHVFSKPVDAPALIHAIAEAGQEGAGTGSSSGEERDPLGSVRASLRAKLWASLSDRKDKMEAALLAGDDERLARLCHQLKGTALNCHDQPLACLADSLEQAVRNGNGSLEMVEAWVRLRSALLERAASGVPLAK